MAQTPAGWYDDGTGTTRWFDGERWTEQVRPPANAPGLAGVADRIAADAVAGGIAHEAVEADAVLDRAVAVAADLAPLRGANYAGIRAGLMAGALAHLDEPIDRL